MSLRHARPPVLAIALAAAAAAGAAPAVAAPPPGLLPGWPVPGATDLDVASDGRLLRHRESRVVEVLARDGLPRRRVRLPSAGPVTAGPRGLIYAVGQADDRVAAVSLANGRVVWRTPSFEIGREASEKGVVVAPGGATLYVPGSDSLTALEPDGRIRWSVIGQGETAPSQTAVAPDGTVVSVFSGGGPQTVQARRPDGTLRYTVPLAGAGAVAVGPDGTAYVGQPRALVAVAPDGAVRFRLTLPGAPNGLVVLRDGRVVASVGGTLRCVRPDGTGCWSLRLGVGLGAPALARDGSLLVPAEGMLVAVTTGGAVRWRWRTAAGTPTTPVVTPDGTIHTVSLDVLYALGRPPAPVPAARVLALPAVFRTSGAARVCTGPVGRARCRPATPVGTVVRVRVRRVGVVSLRVRCGPVSGTYTSIRVRAGVAHIWFPGLVSTGGRTRLLPPGRYRLEAVLRSPGRAPEVVATTVRVVRP